MKVRLVWKCQCGETSLLAPVSERDTRLIVKGSGGRTSDAFSRATVIFAYCCSDRYLLVPTTANVNELKRIWQCDCESTQLLRSDAGKGDMLIKGEGFVYGDPPTHIKCSECGNRFRIAPDIVWAHELKQQKQKRAKSKKNRRAKKRQ